MWYSASLMHKSGRTGSAPAKEPLWEESVVLLQAEDENDAVAKAIEIGNRNEIQYAAADGYTVRWTFEGVNRICELLADTFVHGTEVFSRFLGESEVSVLSQRPQQKSLEE